MNKWLFHQNGFTRTSLSATVTRVSNLVEENMCVCFLYLTAKETHIFNIHLIPDTLIKFYPK